MVDIVSAVFSAAKLLYSVVKAAQSNKKQLKRLGERVERLLRTIEPQLSRAHADHVVALTECLKDAVTHVGRFNKRNFLQRVVHARGDKDAIAKLNDRLSVCCNDLVLSLGVQNAGDVRALFNKLEDEQDAKEDMQVVLETVRDEAALKEGFEEYVTEVARQNPHQHDANLIRASALQKWNEDLNAAAVVGGGEDDEQLRAVRQSVRTFIQDQGKTVKRVPPTAAVGTTASSSGMASSDTVEDIRRIAFSDIMMLQKIGSGAFSDVFLGEWISRGVPVAVKRLKMASLSAETEQQFRAELRAMVGLSDAYTASVLGVCLEPCYCIVMELATDGSLEALIHGGGELSWSRKLQLAEDVCTCVHYLHTMAPRNEVILHEDLKPANFILCKGNRLKVCDFGMSATRRESATQTGVALNGGSVPYQAPEVLLGNVRLFCEGKMMRRRRMVMTR